MQIAGSGLRHNANNEIQKVPIQNVFVFFKIIILQREGTRYRKLMFQIATDLRSRTQMNEVYITHLMFIAFVK